MKTFRYFLPALLLALVLGAAGCKPRVELPSLPVLGPAPAWKLFDLDGKVVASDQFKDKVVIVDFWATWCAPCLAEIPDFIKLQDRYRRDGLVIVGVSFDLLSPAQIKEFAEKRGMNYLLVIGDEEVKEQFGSPEFIPATYLIDRAGQLRDRTIGPIASLEEYELLVKSVLKKT